MENSLTRDIVLAEEYNASVNQVWKRYQELGQYTGNGVRETIIHSWEDSKRLGVSPFQNRNHEIIHGSDLEERLERNAELLSFAKPKINHLFDFLKETKTMLSIVDYQGTVLYSSGERSVLKKAEKIDIYDGGIWTEKSAGTNAAGLALKTKQHAQVLYSEHFCEKNHDWFCSAFPILYPYTHELLGVINIAGANHQLNPHTIQYIFSEANQISEAIQQYFFKHALKNHLFLHTALEGIEDEVLIIDRGKNVVERNGAAKSHSTFRPLRTIATVPELNQLVEKVLRTGQSVIREKVKLNQQKQNFICSVYPVTFQADPLGAVIFLRENNEIPALATKKLHPPRSAKTKTTRYSFDDMIGSSREFAAVVKKARKAACIDSTLFLSGETGTGKEVFAQSIHQASDRRHHPFIAINCGAVPHGLLESELFGYEPGAFTGAKSKGQPGKFEMAQGGTIFLDEIADMPLELQVHLLRILEERVVTRLGGDKTIPLDVRVIAATHKNLIQAVEKGEFREDLMYRLQVIQLEIPALRERSSDIPALVHHFIQEMGREFGKQEVFVQEKAMQCLTQYPWPGNIRELRNVIQQALFNMEGNQLTPFDLPRDLMKQPEDGEKERVIEALVKENGNVTAAAGTLQISRATMYRKLKQYQLKAEDWKGYR
jgi:sigma-54 dependent transcriptional regulator, acetoin dehydrogenase operon transcriptional activator AcoR